MRWLLYSRRIFRDIRKQESGSAMISRVIKWAIIVLLVHYAVTSMQAKAVSLTAHALAAVAKDLEYRDDKEYQSFLDTLALMQSDDAIQKASELLYHKNVEAINTFLLQHSEPSTYYCTIPTDMEAMCVAGIGNAGLIVVTLDTIFVYTITSSTAIQIPYKRFDYTDECVGLYTISDKEFCTVSRSGILHIWSLEHNEPISTITVLQHPYVVQKAVKKNAISFLALIKNVQTGDLSIEERNIQTGKHVRTYTKPRSRTYDEVSMIYGGNMLAIGFRSNNDTRSLLEIWDTKHGTSIMSTNIITVNNRTLTNCIPYGYVESKGLLLLATNKGKPYLIVFDPVHRKIIHEERINGNAISASYNTVFDTPLVSLVSTGIQGISLETWKVPLFIKMNTVTYHSTQLFMPISFDTKRLAYCRNSYAIPQRISVEVITLPSSAIDPSEISLLEMMLLLHLIKNQSTQSDVAIISKRFKTLARRDTYVYRVLESFISQMEEIYNHYR